VIGIAMALARNRDIGDRRVEDLHDRRAHDRDGQEAAIADAFVQRDIIVDGERGGGGTAGEGAGGHRVRQ
jgi:hypothetical protein